MVHGICEDKAKIESKGEAIDGYRTDIKIIILE